jgi:glycosyltransferase involved in cell wall biosynthesis
MKINYFSPLLPAQSGISEVAELVIPALSQYAEVTAWTDQKEWSLALEQYAKMRFYEPGNFFWRDLNGADLNIYHIGNNVHYHHDILRMSQQIPGLVVLHDINLQHLFYGVYCVRQADGEGYIGGITKYHGAEGGKQARRFLAGEIPIAQVEHCTMTEWALENAAAVMVHNPEAWQELSTLQRWPIGYQPLAFHAPPLLAEIERKTALPYRLVIFGYIGHNRRVQAVLQALSELPTKAQFQLDIYGSVDDERALQQQIEQYKVKSIVTVHGFVEDTVLDRALANAHLAINLRYPTMGEASLSQLRIWRHALPAMVTQVGWYATQPADTVLFVRPESEVADIKEHLQRLVDQPASLSAIGLQGRKLLEEKHSPDAYARALIEFGQEVAIGYQQANAQYFIQRVGQEVAPWQVEDFGDRELARITEAMHFFSRL